MARTSVIVGLLLAVVGGAGYIVSNMVSPTALIPAAFGVAIVMLGVYGREATRRRTAMHLAMGVALVGIVGSIGGLFTVISSLSGGATPGLAASSKAAMAVVLIAYLTIGIRSFIAARAARG
jgi:hypothetical protein